MGQELATLSPEPAAVAAPPTKELTPKEQTAKHLSELQKELEGLEGEKKDGKASPKQDSAAPLSKTQEASLWLGGAIDALGVKLPPEPEEEEEEEDDEKDKAKDKKPEPKGAKPEEKESPEKVLSEKLTAVEIQIRSLRQEYTDNWRFQDAIKCAHRDVQVVLMQANKAVKQQEEEEKEKEKASKKTAPKK